MSDPKQSARIIVVSDRVFGGERPDSATPAASGLLESAGFAITGTEVVPEGADGVVASLDRAIEAQTSLILTCGGTGLGPRNLTPEATAERVVTRLHGVETQILLAGLEHSDRAALSRGIVGLTSREPGGSLLVNAPSSRGGVVDALQVVLPLWPSIWEWLG